MHEEIPSYDVGRATEAAIGFERNQHTKKLVCGMVAAEIFLGVGVTATAYEAENRVPSPPAVIEPQLIVTDITASRNSFPGLEGDYDQDSQEVSFVDWNQTTESTVIYRHAGLEGLSFARPSFETNVAIGEATTAEELQQAVDPFFASLGMKLYISDESPLSHEAEYIEISDKEVSLAKYYVRSVMDVVSRSPRELLEFAQVQDIYLPFASPESGQPTYDAAGYAVQERRRRGIVMVVREGVDYMTMLNVVNHEFGHHIGDRLNEETDGGFQQSIANAHPAWFRYRDEITSQGEANYQDRENFPRAHDIQVSTAYGMGSWSEDNAEIYAELEKLETTPDPADIAIPFGSVLYDKKAIMIDSIDNFVPGYKQYKIGMDTLYIYHAQRTPTRHNPELDVIMGSDLEALIVGDKYNKYDSNTYVWERTD